MDKPPLNGAVLNGNSAVPGPVTRERVKSRARELALIAGHAPPHVAQRNYEQAKREVTGESEVDLQEAMLDLISEAERWDPLPNPTGRRFPESPSDDEDEEGRNTSAQLVADGVRAAGREQLQQAAGEAPGKG